MTLNGCLTVLMALLVSDAAPSAQSQAPSGGSVLRVMILDEAPPNGVMRLWLVIRNGAPAPRIFCRRSWSYAWTSASANNPVFGETKGSIHGCGDDDHDAFWLLVPGEYRFDSVEAKAPERANYDLEVEVELVERALNSAAAVEQTITWNGRMSDAIALGESVKAGRFGK
jgi:hypothetical protein